MSTSEQLARVCEIAVEVYRKGLGSQLCDALIEAAARIRVAEDLAIEFAEAGFPGFAARLRGVIQVDVEKGEVCSA